MTSKTQSDDVRRELTDFGFNFGALIVERMWSDKGYVAVRLRAGRTDVIVQASPTGRTVHVTRTERKGRSKR